MHRVHKSVGGLIRAEFFVEDGRYGGVSISGDFFCFPKDAVSGLARDIESSPIDRLPAIIARFYQDNNCELPGIEIDDWLRVFRIS